jgi:NitT/TauT family transport system permease protein
MLRPLPADRLDVRRLPSRFDLLALAVVLGLLAYFGEASRGLLEPLAKLAATPLDLAPIHLFEYAARTTLRMLAALFLSLVFTFTYATWAAKSARAARILIPLLDILQSVPILGFISVTVVFFMALAPGRVLGAEFAAVFAIFTSQAWNMAFSFYQSLRTVPVELTECCASFQLSKWSKFWRLEVPFGIPALIWNMMMSMSGGWFFVVASEAISVGHTTVTLPGVGSYIALAIEQRNLHAVGWAIAAMLIVILLYDQLLFRPLVTWSDRFRFEHEPGARAPQSWFLTALRNSPWVAAATRSAGALMGRWLRAYSARMASLRRSNEPKSEPSPRASRRLDLLANAVTVIIALAALGEALRFLSGSISAADVGRVAWLGFLTMIRVFVLLALASVVWVPIGVWVGLRPRTAALVQPVAQFMAAFPANLLFPIAVYGIVRYRLNPNIWLSPLMILGTQWYILFNVIAGATALPNELRLAARNLGVGGALWWRTVALPGVFPYYVTGGLTASGGSWNAAIVAEVASWGDTQVRAEGLGAYIADATTAGDFHRIVLGIIVMSLFVVVINRVFWRPLYRYAERKFRLD